MIDLVTLTRRLWWVVTILLLALWLRTESELRRRDAAVAASWEAVSQCIDALDHHGNQTEELLSALRWMSDS